MIEPGLMPRTRKATLMRTRTQLETSNNRVLHTKRGGYSASAVIG